jgi:hypothetical protein
MFPPRIEHLWVRPSWDCRICGQTWPCATAKESLIGEYQRFPTVLTIYLFGQMATAFDDLMSHGESPPPDLYERFLSWAAPRSST